MLLSLLAKGLDHKMVENVEREVRGTKKWETMLLSMVFCCFMKNGMPYVILMPCGLFRDVDM